MKASESIGRYRNVYIYIYEIIENIEMYKRKDRKLLDYSFLAWNHRMQMDLQMDRIQVKPM